MYECRIACCIILTLLAQAFFSHIGLAQTFFSPIGLGDRLSMSISASGCKRRRPDDACAADPTDRSQSNTLRATLPANALSALVGCGTRTGLTKVLEILQAAGALQTNDSARTIRRALQASAVEHAQARTPYGRLVETMSLGGGELHDWQFCNPCAWMWYMSTLSPMFGDVMRGCLQPGQPMTIVLYVDEVAPGNPLRPHTSRKFQAIYWFVLEWPQWLLSRTSIWPMLGTLKNVKACNMPGG